MYLNLTRETADEIEGGINNIVDVETPFTGTGRDYLIHLLREADNETDERALKSIAHKVALFSKEDGVIQTKALIEDSTLGLYLSKELELLNVVPIFVSQV